MAEADLLRLLTSRARWAMGIRVYWPLKRTPFGAGFCPCFPGTDCWNGWSCPALHGEQELEAAQPWDAWQEVEALVRSGLAPHVWTSLHVVWLHLSVLLASFLSSGAPGNLAGCLPLVFHVHMQWIWGFPCRLFFAVPLAFLSGNGVGSSRKRFNKSIHVLILEGPSPQNLDTLNET